MNSMGFSEAFCSPPTEFTWKVFHLKKTKKPRIESFKRYRVFAEEGEELEAKKVPHERRIFREFFA